MTDELFFPAGLALDTAFCNRQQERAFLKKCLLNNQHLVLISPRRYGKTSLIHQALSEVSLPYCAVDFLPATHLIFVKNALLAAVSALLTQLLPTHKKISQKLLGFFSNLNPRIVLSAAGQQVELTPHRGQQKSILEALLGLEEVAKTLKKRAVVVLDEFQQVSTLNENQEIEASIRHAVERSKYITYIFSGSNRQLLTQMFHDKRRPLYHLCELMKLERISLSDYAVFIQAAAKKKWKKELAKNVIQTILDLTECHTYYVGMLCRKLWSSTHIPTTDRVNAIWHNAVFEQFPWIAEDIGDLSVNQRLVLAALGHEPASATQPISKSEKFNILASKTGSKPFNISATNTMIAACLPPIRNTLVAPGFFEPSRRGSASFIILQTKTALFKEPTK
jgi:hypothetical protein